MSAHSPNNQPPAPQAQPAAAQAAAAAPQKSMVSGDTRARWRVMLASQIGAGRNYDLGQLVETVVSRICDEQSASIGSSAKGMTEVDAMREAVQEEMTRTKEFLDKQAKETLNQPYQGQTIARVSGADQQPLQLKKGQANNTMTRSHVARLVKHTPMESPMYTKKALTQYLDRLAKQDEALVQERTNLDTRMKRALEERTRIVTNLSVVSKELYELAKDVAAELKQKSGAAPQGTTELKIKPATQTSEMKAAVPAGTTELRVAQGQQKTSGGTTELRVGTAPPIKR